MYAILSISGRQIKVEPEKFIYVNRMPQAEGETVVLNDVLLVENGGNIQIGQPTVAGASVKVKVLSHLKDDKITVFKKKRRKGYRVKRGHRQGLTKLKIEAINA
jgi:large subunit ribosomal protein L21